MTLTQNDVTAVVLSGGAAHGAYEVGVLQALVTGAAPTTQNNPLNPDVITGTSIGAYNGAVLASRLEIEDSVAALEYLRHVWLDIIPHDGDSGHNHIFRIRGNPADILSAQTLFRPDRTASSLGADALYFARDFMQRGSSFFTSSGPWTQRAIGLIDLSTLISSEPAERLIRETIEPEHLRLSHRPLFFAVTNWRTGQLEYFRNRDMTDDIWVDVILASAALPGIVPPVSIRKEVYVDGGLSLNTPLAPAFVEAKPGADTAHVIYLDPETADIPLEPLHSTVSTLDRLINIALSRSVESDMRDAHRVNRGLQLFDKARSGEQFMQSDMKALVKGIDYVLSGIGGRLPMSPKTIHRYRPSRFLGGTMSLADFTQDHVQSLLDLGFQDAVNHDCVKSRCVLPDGMQGEQTPPAAEDVGLPHVLGPAEWVGCR